MGHTSASSLFPWPSRSLDGNRLAKFFLGCLCLFVFYQCASATLIQLDDPKHIWDNPQINPPHWAGTAKLWTEPYFGLYVPVTYTTWAGVAFLSTQLLGHIAPSVFHVFNLLLHFANALLVFSILQTVLLRSLKYDESDSSKDIIWSALIGAAFFAVHPTQVETVLWISCLKDLLCTFFSLLCFHAFLKTERSPGYWMSASLFFTLALLSKPSAVTLPLMAFVLALFFAGGRFSRLRRSVWMWCFVCSVVGVVWVLFTKSLQPSSDLPFVPSWIERVPVALDALGYYFLKVLWPWSLSLDYGRTPQAVLHHLWKEGMWLLPLFLAPCVWLYRNTPALWGTLFFSLALLPVLGIVPFLFQMFSTVTDHYLSFALFGISWTVCFVSFQSDKSIQAACAALVGVLAIFSFTQVNHWKDGIAVFNQAIRVNPKSLVSHNNLGVEYQGRGDFFSAAQHFQRAIELAPERSDLYSNLGAALVSAGEVKEGLHYLHLAEQRTDRSPVSLHNLARAYLRAGNYEKARHYTKLATERDPSFRPPAWAVIIAEDYAKYLE